MVSFSNFFFIQPSVVVVESVTNEWGSLGQYFVFDPTAWVANFGSFVDSMSVANDVKVCRSGVEIWSGDVTVFEPTLTAFSGTVTTHIGRRGGSDLTASAAGDWEANDVIVPSSTSCPEFYDIIQIADSWRLAQICEESHCSIGSHFSISAPGKSRVGLFCYFNLSVQYQVRFLHLI